MEPVRRLWSTPEVPGAHDPKGPIGTRRTGGGFGVLPFVDEPPPPGPATNASWAWSLRRLARAAVWLLPAYAILYGAVAMASDGGVGNDPYPADGRALYLIGWVAAVWLGLLALLGLTGLLAATRSRHAAVSGLLVSIAGTVLMLPFAGLSEQTPVFGTTARSLVLLGATCYSAGWLLTGWAVARSGDVQHRRRGDADDRQSAARPRRCVDRIVADLRRDLRADLRYRHRATARAACCPGRSSGTPPAPAWRPPPPPPPPSQGPLPAA